MASIARKKASPGKSKKPISAADRIRKPPSGPTNGITRAQIKKVIRDLRLEREAKQRSEG